MRGLDKNYYLPTELCHVINDIDDMCLMLERKKMHKTSINGFFKFILLSFVFGTLAMAEPQNDSIPLTAQEVHPLAVGDSTVPG